MADKKLRLIIEGRNNANRALRDLNQHLSASEKAVGALSRGMGLLVGALGAREMITGVKAMFDMSVRAEKLDKAFTAIEGSASGAMSTLNFLRAESDRLGLSFYDTAEASKTFFASAEGTTLERDAKKIFSSVMSASTALALSAEETNGILLALGQMISKGTVQAEELRGQLGERLPGAFRLAAEAMGVTTAELDDMLRKGEVIADELLPKLADALNKNFTPELNSAQQATNRFNTQWDDFKANFINSDAIVAGINAVTVALRAYNREARGDYSNLSRDELSSRIQKFQGLDLNEYQKNDLQNLWRAWEALDPDKTNLMTPKAPTASGGKTSSGGKSAVSAALKEIGLDASAADTALADFGLTVSDLAGNGFARFYEGVDASAEAVRRLTYSAVDGFEQMQWSFRSFGDMFTYSVVESLSEGKDAWGDYFAYVAKGLAELAIQQSITNPLFDAIAGGTGASGGSFTPTMDFSKFSLGFRAGGGDVYPGRAYVVGEKGPEILAMGRQGGSIVPNHAIGGTTVQNYITIDARGADKSVEMRIEAAVERATEAAYHKVLRDKKRGGPMSR